MIIKSKLPIVRELVSTFETRQNRSITYVKARGGGSGVKITSLAYIKVQPVMELRLFTESQNLRYDENMALQSLGVLLGPYKI